MAVIIRINAQIENQKKCREKKSVCGGGAYSMILNVYIFCIW